MDDIIIVLIGFIITILLFLVCCHFWKKSRPKTLEEKFEDTSSSSPIGGLFISMIGPDDITRIITQKSFEYKDFYQCAPLHRKSCAAFTYIRKDVCPMTFIVPQNPPIMIGLIFDPEKLFPLVTTTSIIDADTLLRSCGSNEKGVDITSQYCITDNFKTQLNGKDGYYPSSFAGTCSIAPCDPSDDVCKQVNSGGSPDMWNMLCYHSDLKNCYSIADDGGITLSDKCTAVQKPHLCTFTDATDSFTEKSKMVASYVGKDGELWPDKFMAGDDINIPNTSITQCKYDKLDWEKWVNSLKAFYKKLLTYLKPDGNVIAPKYEVLLSYPNAVIYLENEVNAYINPDTASSYYKSQNNRFIDSVSGIFVIDNTCEDQLAEIKNFTTNEFATAEARCDAYWGVKGDARRTLEKQAWLASYGDAVALRDLFKSQYKKSVPMYAAVLPSNTFASYKQLTSSVNGKTKFGDLFELMTELPTV